MRAANDTVGQPPAHQTATPPTRGSFPDRRRTRRLLGGPGLRMVCGNLAHRQHMACQTHLPDGEGWRHQKFHDERSDHGLGGSAD